MQGSMDHQEGYMMRSGAMAYKRYEMGFSFLNKQPHIKRNLM